MESVSGYLLLGMRLAEGDVKAADNWNFGPDNSSFASVKDITERAFRLLGQGFLQIEPDLSKHEATELTLDVTKANRQLGWRSKWGTDEAILKTVEWYQKVEYDPSVARAVTKAQIEDYFNVQNLEKKSL